VLSLDEGVTRRQTALRVSVVGVLGTDDRLVQNPPVIGLQYGNATIRMSVAYPLRTLVAQINMHDVVPRNQKFKSLYALQHTEIIVVS